MGAAVNDELSDRAHIRDVLVRYTVAFRRKDVDLSRFDVDLQPDGVGPLDVRRHPRRRIDEPTPLSFASPGCAGRR